MKLLKLVPDNTNIGFVAVRNWAFALTALLTVLAVGATLHKGLNLGVDFVGGLMIEAKFPQPVETDKVRSTIGSLGVGESSLQQFGDPKTVQIRLPLPEQGGAGAANAVVEKTRRAMTAQFPGVTFSRYDTVSGKVSGELIQNGVLAVLLAVFGIAIFSWFRYEWQFGVSTFVAIMHDVLMTLGFFAVTQLEFDLNIIAAVLTIVGYSINDKMVIDDRIRENMRKYRKMDMKALIDLSVNETLPRTVMTSVTIMLALGALLIFGGHVLRGFTAAMMLGIIVGTYSSVYVSSSLLITLGLKPALTDKKADKGIAAQAERMAPRDGAQPLSDRRTGIELRRDDTGQGPIVTGFSGHGFRVRDDVFPGGLLLSPTRALAWDAPAGVDVLLDLTALGDLLDIDPAPEFLLLGTGPGLHQPPRAFVRALEGRGIGVEAMDSRAAARAWGVLRAEERWIVAALLPS